MCALFKSAKRTRLFPLIVTSAFASHVARHTRTTRFSRWIQFIFRLPLKLGNNDFSVFPLHVQFGSVYIFTFYNTKDSVSQVASRLALVYKFAELFCRFNRHNAHQPSDYGPIRDCGHPCNWSMFGTGCSL